MLKVRGPKRVKLIYISSYLTFQDLRHIFSCLDRNMIHRPGVHLNCHLVSSARKESHRMFDSRWFTTQSEVQMPITSLKVTR